ncbi:LAETG motif-containing sortase-dependent surface protein [Streptomyces sp. NPDC005329]|uniref:LAETG motif-containing sortase-dependent surface protein n=1 Tax=Streptomyces sp. NPDC005329 TaxID=3157034 RepID=UPI0033B558B3
MSRSPRAARAARVMGTLAASAVLAIGAAHTALACSIADFSAAAVCDADGHGVIQVTDKDASGTPATVSLYLQLNQPINNQRLVDTQKIEHPTAQGVTVDLNPQTWHAGVTFRVHVEAGDLVDDDIQPLVVIQDETCAAAGPSASSSGSSSASSEASASPSDRPSTSSPSSSSSSPSSSASSSAQPTPARGGGAPSAAGGGTALAETGGSSRTPVIGGVAAALVLAGGGIVLGLRRRTATRSH